MIQDNPQQEPLFNLAPQPTPPKKKLAGWHITVLAIGVPVIAFLSCVGGNMVAHWALSNPPAAKAAATHKLTPHKSKPAPPKYDFARYQSAITGPEENAFAPALWKLRTEIGKANYAAAVDDAPKLVAPCW